MHTVLTTINKCINLKVHLNIILAKRPAGGRSLWPILSLKMQVIVLWGSKFLLSYTGEG